MRIQERVLLRRIGCSLAVLLAVTFIIATATHVYPLRRYNLTAQRINQKIISVESQRPPDLSPELWEASVAWGSIAFCNICFSESHAPYGEMCRFERDLDVRLAKQIDLEFFEWLWSRLAAVSPHGAAYVARQKPNWDERVQAELNEPQSNREPSTSPPSP